MPLRLGYACLNTGLRKQKPSVFCSRTCRIATLQNLGPLAQAHLEELSLQNVADLATMTNWNKDHGIHFMRISSDLFPFASHPKYHYDIGFAQDALKRVGDLAKSYTHRLTMHPGQYNQLGSKSASVVDNTIRDLTHHADILDKMEMGPDAALIIHMGGHFNDKPTTIARWKKAFKRLPKNVADRIVLENDEMSFNAEEILPICHEFGIPLVFDWHHHDLNPGTRSTFDETLGKNMPHKDLLDEIGKTWTDRGIRQKMHYSESKPQFSATHGSMMERRSHSDAIVSLPPPVLDMDVDLMIEAKLKEQCVLWGMGYLRNIQ